MARSTDTCKREGGCRKDLIADYSLLYPGERFHKTGWTEKRKLYGASSTVEKSEITPVGTKQPVKPYRLLS